MGWFGSLHSSRVRCNGVVLWYSGVVRCAERGGSEQWLSIIELLRRKRLGVSSPGWSSSWILHLTGGVIPGMLLHCHWSHILAGVVVHSVRRRKSVGHEVGGGWRFGRRDVGGTLSLETADQLAPQMPHAILTFAYHAPNEVSAPSSNPVESPALSMSHIRLRPSFRSCPIPGRTNQRQWGRSL